MPDALALEPELAAVALDDVAHASAAVAVLAAAHRAPSPSPSRSRCSSPGRSRPGPAARPRSGGLQAQSHRLHAMLVDQPAGEVGERLQQRVAVDLQPQRRIDLVGARPQPSRGLRCAARRPRPGRRRACPPAASASSAPVGMSPASGLQARRSSPRPRRARPPGSARASALRGRAARASRPPPAGCRARRGCLRSGRCSRRSRSASCSKSRVMSSSIRTKPLSPPSTSPSLAGSCTGAICTRSSWPAGVPVTNCADGLAAPRRRRWRTLSSACAISGRSKTA